MTQIEAYLATRDFCTLDEICKGVFGRIDERKRGAVRVVLHRLDEQGKLEKLPRKYALRKS